MTRKPSADAIRELLIAGVEKRLDADAPVGFLLSGGLDSSLVCAIAAQKLRQKPIRTFAIGMDVDAIDLKYAREVADFIGSEHTEVIMHRERRARTRWRRSVHLLGTYDITTIRASIGMYLVCKAHPRARPTCACCSPARSPTSCSATSTPTSRPTPARVPGARREAHPTSCTCTTCCAPTAASPSTRLEARVPFGDLDFVHYVMSIDPEHEDEPLRQGQVPAAPAPSPTTTACPTTSSGGRRRPSATPWATPWSTT